MILYIPSFLSIKFISKTLRTKNDLLKLSATFSENLTRQVYFFCLCHAKLWIFIEEFLKNGLILINRIDRVQKDNHRVRFIGRVKSKCRGLLQIVFMLPVTLKSKDLCLKNREELWPLILPSLLSDARINTF